MRLAFLQLHIAVFLAGFTGVLGRLITLNEGLLVWYRLLITVGTLWILYFFQKRIRTISWTDTVKVFGIGIIAALHWVTFYASIKQANVSVALVCFSSIGFFTALVEPLVMKHRVRATEILLGLLTIAGILLIFHFEPHFKTGIILGSISAFLGCLFPILNRKVLRRLTPQTVTLLELSGGFLFLTMVLPFYLWWFPPDHFLPTVNDLSWLLVLSLACTVLAFSLSMRALRHISAFTVNLTYNLEPVYGILLAFIIYREDKALSENFYWGLALILISVMIQTILVYRKQRTLS